MGWSGECCHLRVESVCVCVQMRRSAEAHAAHWIRLADGERAGLITSV